MQPQPPVDPVDPLPLRPGVSAPLPYCWAPVGPSLKGSAACVCRLRDHLLHLKTEVIISVVLMVSERFVRPRADSEPFKH